MGSLRRAVSESTDIAAAAITQDVVDLVLGKTDGVVRVDAKLGRLSRKLLPGRAQPPTAGCVLG